MVESVQRAVKKWENEMGGTSNEIEVDVLKESHFLAAEILSKTAFGGNFEEGKRIFQLQDQQAMFALQL